MDYSFDRWALHPVADCITGIQQHPPSRRTQTQTLASCWMWCWVDGYFMTTDGASLIVTELSNPLAVNPLKYGSSEVDPDPVVALLKLRNEVYALNRNTIEVFDNVGGDLFPFARIDGAQIQKGVIGTHLHAASSLRHCILGWWRNEAPGIYVAQQQQPRKSARRKLTICFLNTQRRNLVRSSWKHATTRITSTCMCTCQTAHRL
jgi:hypothetical protein